MRRGTSADPTASVVIRQIAVALLGGFATYARQCPYFASYGPLSTGMSVRLSSLVGGNQLGASLVAPTREAMIQHDRGRANRCVRTIACARSGSRRKRRAFSVTRVRKRVFAAVHCGDTHKREAGSLCNSCSSIVHLLILQWTNMLVGLVSRDGLQYLPRRSRRSHGIRTAARQYLIAGMTFRGRRVSHHDDLGGLPRIRLSDRSGGPLECCEHLRTVDDGELREPADVQARITTNPSNSEPLTTTTFSSTSSVT